MKKILMMGAAFALIAGSASAQSANWQGENYADENVTFGMSAEVVEFCKFNERGGVATYADGDESFTPGAIAGVGGSSAPQGDGNITLDIQDLDDNTAKTSGIVVSYEKTVCNTPFEITARSVNGGLLHESGFGATSDDDYAELVPYYINAYFDGSEQGRFESEILNGGFVAGKSEAWAGTFGMGIRTDVLDKLLVEGTYQDTLYIRMLPTVSGSSS